MLRFTYKNVKLNVSKVNGLNINMYLSSFFDLLGRVRYKKDELFNLEIMAER